MEDISPLNAAHRLSIESLDDFTSLWRKHRETLSWTCPFVLPPWVNAWWKVFGHGPRPLIAVLRHGESVTGIAPLMVRDKTVQFLGSSDLCDYFDFIVARDDETRFFPTLFAELSAQGIKDMDLGPMRPDATVQKFLSKQDLVDSMECHVDQEDVFSELDLPNTWDGFLGALTGKQRHELRRKLRRLEEAGDIRFRKVDNIAHLPEAMEIFLQLFTMNREDKAAFMTPSMVLFFQTLASALAEEGLLRLFLLDVDKKPVASVFCLDHQGTRYLYNNGYDHAYQGLSVGLISKVLSLKTAIDDGLRCYNFLKGGETYKRHLGGKEIPLSRCRITLR
jgi:CelD/BcsL family acetyltransferase involved in cellulose biosynthesis